MTEYTRLNLAAIQAVPVYFDRDVSTKRLVSCSKKPAPKGQRSPPLAKHGCPAIFQLYVNRAPHSRVMEVQKPEHNIPGE